jgi:hypothetical protein
MNISFLQLEGHPSLDAAFNGLVEQLKAHDITAEFITSPRPADTEPEPDLTILHNSDSPRELLPNRVMLGRRTINRHERLVAAQDAGAPVTPWISPSDPRSIPDFFSAIDADKLVFKRDLSLRRNAVQLISSDEPPPQDIVPMADVVMKLLTLDPITYKTDVFVDTFVGAYALPTRAIGSPDFLEPSPRAEAWEPPAEVMEACRKVGRALLPYGCGYFSIDWMRAERGFSIIEINTCNVGLRRTWLRWPSYLENYVTGIRNFLASGLRAPTTGESFLAAGALRSRLISGNSMVGK